jgi:hypothetical protein
VNAFNAMTLPMVGSKAPVGTFNTMTMAMGKDERCASPGYPKTFYVSADVCVASTLMCFRDVDMKLMKQCQWKASGLDRID